MIRYSYLQYIFPSNNITVLKGFISLSYFCFLSCCIVLQFYTLQWRHNERDGVSNHRRHDCLFNRLFRRRSKKTSKLRVTGLCEGNSPVTGEFPAQRTSNAENVSIWWRHHNTAFHCCYRDVFEITKRLSCYGRMRSCCSRLGIHPGISVTVQITEENLSELIQMWFQTSTIYWLDVDKQIVMS